MGVAPREPLDYLFSMTLQTACLALLFLAGPLACGDTPSTASSATAESSSSARTTNRTPSGSATPASPASAPRNTVKGEVDKREGAGKITYSIDLPEGLKDVSDSEDRGIVKSYGKEPKKFDGITFTVLAASPKHVTAGLDGTLTNAEKSADFVKNQAKILQKDSFAGGWYFALSIQEGEKKAVVLTAIITKGDLSLTCKAAWRAPWRASLKKYSPLS